MHGLASLGVGTRQRQRNANAFALPLLELVECEGNGKHRTHEANANLPFQNASYCWTQSYVSRYSVCLDA
jgi:hypothetical protein